MDGGQIGSVRLRRGDDAAPRTTTVHADIMTGVDRDQFVVGAGQNADFSTRSRKSVDGLLDGFEIDMALNSITNPVGAAAGRGPGERVERIAAIADATRSCGDIFSSIPGDDAQRNS